MLRRHGAFVLLLLALLCLGAQSLGCYLKSDDFRWVADTLEKAADPWAAFTSGPLWGSYYRPTPSFVWLLNYQVWGFEFEGYQLTLIAMWGASVALLYGIGVTLRGRLAGFLAAGMFGLNGIYLRVVSWKAWFTTVTELFFTLLAILLYLRALRRRRTWPFVLAGVAGAAAVLSRELAPLVLSAVVFATLLWPGLRRGGLTRGRLGGLALWAGVTLATLMALPSYRQAAHSLLVRPFQSKTAATGDASFSLGHFSKDVTVQLHALYLAGCFAIVAFYAALAEATRTTGLGRRLGARRHYVLAGALVCAAVLVALLAWLAELAADASAAVEKTDARALAARYASWARVGEYAVLTVFWLWAAPRRRGGLMLALWFVVSFLPTLFLAHHSPAYQMMAFAAFALFMGQTLDREVRGELLPVWRAARGNRPRRRDWPARRLRAVLVALALVGVAWMAAKNVADALPTIRLRVREGVEDRRAVTATVNAAIKGFASKRAYVLHDPLAELAGTILRVRHGFTIRLAEPKDGMVAPFRPDALRLGVFERAAPLAGLARANRVPNSGFELGASPRYVTPGYRGKRAFLVVTAGGRVQRETLRLDPPPPPGCYAFGAAVRADAGVHAVRLGVRVEGTRDAEARAFPRPLGGGWRELTGCVNVAPGARYVALEFEVEARPDVKGAEARLDDVFFVRVAPEKAGTRPPLSSLPESRPGAPAGAH